MSEKEISVSVGPGFLALLGLLFIGLKLGHVIDWPWYVVTLPLWGGLALWLALFSLAMVFYLVVGVYKILFKR